MKITLSKRGMRNTFTLVGFTLLLFVALFGVGIISSDVIGVNITNHSVIAKVNVTNTEPVIQSLEIDDEIDTPAGFIDLTPNDVKIVSCNATVFDYNGAGDLTAGKSSAILYINNTLSLSNDNNYRYENSSCNSCVQLTATTAECECKFAVQYYANYSDAWACQFNITDGGGTQVLDRKINLSAVNTSGFVTVSGLMAINTSDIIDYGNLSVTEQSEQIEHNVTNVGNLDFNLTLRGFGGETDSVTNENVTMICDFGNISFGNQRYQLATGSPFDSMVNLTNQTVVTNQTFPQRTNDAQIEDDRNSTFWRLEVPLSVGGLCNGTIVFGAIQNI